MFIARYVIINNNLAVSIMKNVNKNQQFFINELNEQREELINTYGEDKGIKNWVDQDYYDGEYYITPSYR